MLTVAKNPRYTYLLVKLPRITSSKDGFHRDATAAELREQTRLNVLGGEKATVRKLTRHECLALGVREEK